MSAKLDLVLLLRPDVPPITLPDGSFVFRASEGGALALRRPSPGVAAAFEKLRTVGAIETQLAAQVATQDGPAGLISFYQYLSRLGEYALLCHRLELDGQPLITIMPTARHYRFQPGLVSSEGQYTLSRFAYCHNVGNQMVLESPLGYAKLILHDARVAGLLTELTQPRRCADLAGSLPEDAVLTFVNFLLNAKALAVVMEDGRTNEVTDSALGQWDFHDMLFHTSSRLGRHNNPYGGTYRSRGKFDPLPLIKPHMSDEVIPLDKPDLDTLKQNDLPFTAVLEERRSVREYGEAPLTKQQLGEFLYRVARFKHLIPQQANDQEAGLRPYPSGGAIHELEIYPIIDRCEGLSPGLYHYNALEHSLDKLADRNDLVDTLLNLAWLTADRKSRPQVYFGITARFQRLQWKYESIVYCLILKHVGIVFQTMYLVATAMGLAPCALGGGNSELFKNAVGLDPYAEALVGEFILGSCG